jgi:hypothetical protein
MYKVFDILWNINAPVWDMIILMLQLDESYWLPCSNGDMKPASNQIHPLNLCPEALHAPVQTSWIFAVMS